MLRKAMEEYERTQFLAKSENLTLGGLLDKWIEEDLKPSNHSNGTVDAYIGVVGRIKKHPIGNRKLKKVTAEHLQAYMDLLSLGGTSPDGTAAEPLSIGYLRQYSAVLRGAFRFAVFPKKYISFNPMDYVTWRGTADEYELFADECGEENPIPVISYEQYQLLIDFLKGKENPALLPIQIAYFTGLRIGEACALTWQDIDLKEQCLTVRRSMRYNASRHKMEIGPTKRKKIRTVDFCDTLAAILRAVKKEQLESRFKYGALYRQNYYLVVKEKNRTYYELYTLPRRATTKSLLYACGPMGPMNPPAPSAPCAGRQRRSWRTWTTSISTSSAIHTPATCSLEALP